MESIIQRLKGKTKERVWNNKQYELMIGKKDVEQAIKDYNSDLIKEIEEEIIDFKLSLVHYDITNSLFIGFEKRVKKLIKGGK